jgi:hypothetical protein
MEAIRDLTWMRQLARGGAERFELGGYGVAVLDLPPTSAHHEDRYRYRFLAFDRVLGKPVFSVDLESDILGDYCLSIQQGQEHHILSRYDSPPSLAVFRSRALAEFEAFLALPPSQTPSRDAAGRTDAAAHRHPRATPRSTPRR